MKIEQQRVTPAIAKKWLERNENNRPLSSAAVKNLAGVMSRGKWKVNGDCIRFNCNGRLIDGQHRLYACIESGCSFDTFVVTGLPDEAFDTVDQGKRRSIGDVFARQGAQHYACLAAAVRSVWRLKNPLGFKAAKLGAMGIDEATEILANNPRLTDAVQFARDLAGHKKLIAPGSLSALLFLTRKKSVEQADAFWTSVMTGEGLTKTQPAYRLREQLIDNASSMVKMQPDNVVALCIKAWNIYRAGEECQRLRYTYKEEFPAIK